MTPWQPPVLLHCKGRMLDFVTILILGEDCLSLEDFCSYLYLSWPHEGSTYSVVLAQLSEDLAGLGCVSPRVVPFSARREQNG